jgi:ParB family chromosome partitioning protein
MDPRGELAVLRGLVRMEDRKAQAAKGAAAAGSAGTSAATAADTPPKPEFSERLLRQLTAHRTAALRAMLADNPAVALRVLAWQLALQAGLSASYPVGDNVEIRTTLTDLRNEGPDVAGCRAQQVLDERRQRWCERLPRDQRVLLAWTLAADDAQVLDLLAVCTASTINAVQGRVSPQPIADAIAGAVGLDMAAWWTPTAESYLGAVSKAKVLAAVSEAVSPEAARKLDGLKKDALVAQAQQHLDGKRWLPSVLRAKD